MNDPRGSVWRKWDLHVHTPASILHSNFEGTNETEKWDKYFEKLESLQDISVVGLTDYFSIDGYKKVLEYSRNNPDKLKNITLFFPNVELRILPVTNENSAINLHVIFSPNEEIINNIDSQFFSNLEFPYRGTSYKCTQDDLVNLGRAFLNNNNENEQNAYKVGMQQFKTDINALREVFKKNEVLRNNSLIIVSNSGSDGASGIQHSSLAATRQEIYRFADAVFSGNPTDRNYFLGYGSDIKSEIIRKYGLLKPCVHGSDAHELSKICNPDLNRFTWIKADPTFEGLKQIINEPEERVFIGNEPDVLKRVRNKKTKYISTISFKKVSSSKLNEIWFEKCSPITLNPGLVAIIGNKGSGKSALSDTIGLLGNSKQQDDFSFLNTKKFCDPKDNKAEHFTASINWEDGFSQEMPLSTRVKTDTEVETVAYIPQNYLETICSDEVKGTQFNEELRTVIFSHVEDAERLGCSSLDELIMVKTNEKNAAIDIIKKSILKLNLEIVKLEEMLHPNYKQELENKLKLKEAEKAGLDKPVEVQKPDTTDPQKQKEIGVINNNIKVKQSEIEKYVTSVTSLQAEKIDLSKKINSANTLLQKLDNFQNQFNAFHTECEPLCTILGLEFENIAKLELIKTDINTIKARVSTRLKDVNKELDENNQNGPVYQLNKAKDEVEKLKAALDQDNKIYQKYIKEQQEWKNQCKAIEGNEHNPEEGTIWYYKTVLQKIANNIPSELEKSKKDRLAKVKDIYNKLDELKKEYEQLYASVKEFMKSAPFSDPDRFLLDFNVSIECKGFLENFLSYISQSKSGSFRGIEEGKSHLRSLLEIADFNTYEGLEGFIKIIEDNLTNDRRTEGRGEERRVVEQLKRKEDYSHLYDYLYCLEYLIPEFNLQWSNKKLLQLSPGERGLVLLIFYLFIDKREMPLIIDQPEENLDNESVYKVLMYCIKDAKKKRQIIIVTHNPNLAVVCDAEQVIYSEIDKQNGNKIIYTCGAIENPAINKKLIDVLEGTRPAFDNRDSKYYVKN